MLDLNVRLISILGVLTVIVLAGLTLDYLGKFRQRIRLGLWVAILGIAAGSLFTLMAVLPEGKFYGPVFSEVKTSKKVVALTFDDGPYPPYTGEILDILKENNVPATFFVVGRNAEKYPELLRRMAEEGHQVGNHSYSHMDLLKADRNTIAQEVDRTSAIIRNITGNLPVLVRPPHGFRDPLVMEMMAQRNLCVVEWSVASRDWTNPGVQQIVEQTLAKTKNGAIILLHDGDGIEQKASRQQTVAAVRLIIKGLKEKGYTFVTVGEILKPEE
ncbi:MAG: polysaccharide deacetylase [Firmicutes bacterium]|nr:polysaccharide deacetylase [Bacillota bacterium]